MDDSGILVTPGGIVFTGDGVLLYQARVIRRGLMACKKGLRLNRAYTPTNLFRTTASFTGKTYKRGQYDAAISDLTAWIDAAEAAMPITVTS